MRTKKMAPLPPREPIWDDEQWQRVVNGCAGILPPVPDWAWEDPLLTDDLYHQGYFGRTGNQPLDVAKGSEYVGGWMAAQADIEAGIICAEVSDVE
jgi:hypothetical protein